MQNFEIPNSEAKAKAKEPERPIEIKLPFPNRQRSTKVENQFTKFMKVVKNLEVSIPFTELITQIPSYARFMKDILSRKRELPDTETVALAHESSTLLQGKLPPKLSDPGSFSLTCTIGTLVIDKALCDLGASVSIMPFSVCQRLNMGELKYYGGRVQLADRSLRYPRGMLEDVPVKIGKFFIPVDFLVMDIDEDTHIPIILGRPFLRTAGAVIDVKNGRLTLEVGDDKIIFNLSQALKQPMLEETSCFVDVIDDLVEEVWYESLMRDPLEALMFLDSCADDVDTNSAVVYALEATLNCTDLAGEQNKKVHDLVNSSVAVGASLGTTDTPIKEYKEGQTPSKNERPKPVTKEWVEVKRKPPGERSKVRSLPLVSTPTLPTIEKQVEDLKKELAEAMQIVVTAASRLAALEKKIKPPDIVEYEIGRFGGGTPLPGID